MRTRGLNHSPHHSQADADHFVERCHVVAQGEASSVVLTGTGADGAEPLFVKFVDSDGSTIGPIDVAISEDGLWESSEVDLTALAEGPVRTLLVFYDEDGTPVTLMKSVVFIQHTTSDQPDGIHESGCLHGNLLGDSASALEKTATGGLRVSEISGAVLRERGLVELPGGAFLTVSPDGTFDYFSWGVFTHLRPGELAADRLDFTILDGEGKETSGTLIVNVRGISNTLAAGDDFVSIPVGKKITVPVLKHETSPVGLPQSVVLPEQPRHGYAEINKDGSITFNPAPGYEGTVCINYLVRTPGGRANSGALTFEIVRQFSFDSFNDYCTGIEQHESIESSRSIDRQ